MGSFRSGEHMIRKSTLSKEGLKLTDASTPFEHGSHPFCASRDDVAPDFSAKGFVNNEIQTFTLEQYKGKWLLLFFYPSDFTFV